ncbi:DNA/RNA non-specific endonuclease [Actinoplanes sp. NPDC049316]|uniref:golvesin C-terminal-like domain-containing protein n=1 Tax=Actinoplanes sp. NPDC049316 TaxID=3154727 RepID=UPI00343BCBA0
MDPARAGAARRAPVPAAPLRSGPVDLVPAKVVQEQVAAARQALSAVTGAPRAAENATYYAPRTPARMTPESTHPVEFLLTNSTAATWRAKDKVLTYRWSRVDGKHVDGDDEIRTALPRDLAPGESATFEARVATPDDEDETGAFLLAWEVFDKKTGKWLSQSDGVPALTRTVTIEKPTSGPLGLEKFFSFAGNNTGAGSTLMNNTGTGNSVWTYNAFTNPGRGLTTFARFSYNSQDRSDTGAGHGWSFQLSGPVRLGEPLDLEDGSHPKEVELTDGDGTTHLFRRQADGSYRAPAGVHYRLTSKPGLDCDEHKPDTADAWTMTRPDGTGFRFDCAGYLRSAADKNGNTQTFTYEHRTSGKTKFLTAITDPAGRRTLSVEYYDERSTADDDVENHVKSITDVSGRRITFDYSHEALLTKLTDGAGTAQPKVFRFGYDDDDDDGRLVKVTDPRGNSTSLSYVDDHSDDRFEDWTRSIIDRAHGTTTFGYTAFKAGTNYVETAVTDAEKHTAKHVTDDFDRPMRTVNAKNQQSVMAWDADNNVTLLREANGAQTAYCHDPLTGYPLWERDAEQNRNGVPPQTLCAAGQYPAKARQYEYRIRPNGFSADLVRKTSPGGRTWTFAYDARGNLTAVTDPKGVASPATGDYTSRYEYDEYGQLTKATDANGNATVNADFGPTGYPERITDALNHSSRYLYDERGQVTTATDALGKKTTQAYDTYGRPLAFTEPKDQAAGDMITTPAPVYDANDNVTRATAPNGAVSTAVYDVLDQIVEATAPRDSATAPERVTRYTYDRTGHVRTSTEPKGVASADPGDYTTTNHYDEIYQLTSVVNPLGGTISYRYDDVGNAILVTDPKKNATPDKDDFSAKYTYDLNHRLIGSTDALGNTSTRGYDADSLTVSTRDTAGNETLYAFDERAKPVETMVPRTGTGTQIVYSITRTEYDQVGNAVRVISPRGTQTTDPDDFAARTEYDALNRPVKQFQPYDPADGRYNHADVYTETGYDEAGRISRTSLPPSEGQTQRSDTTYTYFDNGWTKSSTDPWDIVTTYDYNEIGQQTARTLTSAGGSTGRTMGWSYYPNGKLKAKTDDGVPVGSAVPMADNSDAQHVTATGEWLTASAAGQQGFDHRVHAAGAGEDTFTWTLTIPRDGTYTAYVKFPQVSGAATDAKYTITHAGGTTERTVDQTGGAGTWVNLGAYEFSQGDVAKLELAQNAGGVVVADGVKLVRDTSGEADTEKHDFRYGYDLNGNLASIDDLSSGAKADAYTLAYTELDQVRSVTESFKGEAKKATSYTYDANSQAETITHPEQFSRYTYDLRELIATVSVGSSPDDPAPKVTSYTYTDLGQVARETKDNGNTVDTTYFADRTVRDSTEKKADGTLVASHVYGYDANGNKARDEARKMNADDHTAYLDSTTEFTYDPVDRIARSAKTGNGAATETYVHDDNANVISQTVGGVSTTFRYDRNRLQSSTTGGATSAFTFDPFGRQESVSRGGQVVSRNVYDGFDRVVESEDRDADGSMKKTTFAFDPLDRTVSKTADGETTDFSYLGLSQEVLSEEVDGELAKSYQYSPWGQRLSQIKHNTDGTTEDGFYGYNSHTDVETVTDGAGDTKATYGYTAYGNDDRTEFTGIDKPDPGDPTKEQYNSYRFNAKRWDPDSGTYDMGFRDYDPGINRFVTRDLYNGALADMSLATDPFTGNRYAFTGGNPVSNVEIDGHFALLLAAAAAVAVLEVVAVVVVAVVVVLAVAAVVEKVAEEVSEARDDAAEDEAEPERKPDPTPRPPGPATDTDEKKGCGGPWVRHGETDAANGNRATGVEACLTSENIKGGTETSTTVRPPGYNWAGRTVAFLGGTPPADVNNCHLLGKQLGGSGTDLKNLATCSRQANDPGMKSIENQVRAAVDAGQEVHYTVTPIYSGNRTVPTGFHMTAYGTNPDGTPGINIDTIVPNTYNGTNLGTFNDPNTGQPVPTGGTS